MRLRMYCSSVRIWSSSVSFSRFMRETISSYSRISSRSLVILLIHSS